MVESILEQRVRDALRAELDGQVGPHSSWPESPAAQQVLNRGRGVSLRRGRHLRLLALAALLAIAGLKLRTGRLTQPPSSCLASRFGATAR